MRVGMAAAGGALAGGASGLCVSVIAWAALAVATGPSGVLDLVALHLNPFMLALDILPFLGVGLGLLFGPLAFRRVSPPSPVESPGLDPEADQDRRTAQAQLIESIGPELYRPLDALMGYTELALDRLRTDAGPQNESELDGVRRDLESARQKARDLRNVLHGMTTLARATHGKEAAFVEWFALSDAVADGARDGAHPSSPDLQTSDVDGLKVRLDRRRVVAVVATLVDHVRRGVDDGAHVTIEATASTDPPWVQIEVRRTGTIDDAVEPDHALFEPFHPSDTEVPERRRLALAVARAHVETMGGVLFAARGVFRVQLPFDATLYVVDVPDTLVPASAEAPRELRSTHRSRREKADIPAPAPNRPTLIPAPAHTRSARPTRRGGRGRRWLLDRHLSLPPDVEPVLPPRGVPVRGRALVVYGATEGRQLAEKMLSEDGWKVASCTHLAEAMHLASKRPDVIVVDGARTVPDLWALRSHPRGHLLDGVPIVATLLLERRTENARLHLPVHDLIGSPARPDELRRVLQRIPPAVGGTILDVCHSPDGAPGVLASVARREGWSIVGMDQFERDCGSIDLVLASTETRTDRDRLARALVRLHEPPCHGVPLVLRTPRARTPDQATARGIELGAWTCDPRRPRPRVPMSLAETVALVTTREVTSPAKQCSS